MVSDELPSRATCPSGPDRRLSSRRPPPRLCARHPPDQPRRPGHRRRRAHSRPPGVRAPAHLFRARRRHLGTHADRTGAGDGAARHRGPGSAFRALAAARTRTDRRPGARPGRRPRVHNRDPSARSRRCLHRWSPGRGLEDRKPGSVLDPYVGPRMLAGHGVDCHRSGQPEHRLCGYRRAALLG